jgi:hypothetical protein
MLLDAYSLKARWAPALICAAPILILFSAFLGDQSPLLTGAPVAIGSIAALVAVELTRTRGRACEKRLIIKWGGLPTTKALRHMDGPEDRELSHRRTQLELLTGHALPSMAMEKKDPSGADRQYASVVRTAIARMGRESVGAERLQKENTSYGFRRNLRGLRGLGITLVLVGLCTSIAKVVITQDPSSVLLPGTVQIVIGVLWIAVVKDSWVEEQAMIYSSSFFIALDAHLPSENNS